ncbi:hypothetical protein EZV61_10420 [Corallincola luteus]|uniref:DNA gyrase subunit B n=1 Tax=Corallincola luteus TaxID=1775177 RepID=A0ABY2AKW3_9GAMM|nr:hypothetical protein [Corallincola luteus]TCI03284.1 hypothetical protein EZV61_10420 [Corallincola luteus]
MLKALVTITLLVLVISYPVLVYLGLKHLKVSELGVILIGLFIARLCFTAKSTSKKLVLPLSIIGCALALIAIASDSTLSLTFYPVVVNTTMFILFGQSLLYGQTIIEQLARLKHPELPEEGIIYTRKVTWIWTVFFVVNGSIALYTALYCSLEEWTFYNGFIAYIMMGILLLGELIFRRFVLKVG